MLLKVIAAYGVNVRSQGGTASRENYKKKSAKRPIRKGAAEVGMPGTASISVLA